jgi:hypothetical protein
MIHSETKNNNSYLNSINNNFGKTDKETRAYYGKYTLGMKEEVMFLRNFLAAVNEPIVFLNLHSI